MPDLFSSGAYALRSLVALPLASATLILILGTVVGVRERGSHVSILFFALTSSVAFWLYAFSLMYATSDERRALFWAKAAFLAIPCIPTAVYHFVAALARLERRLRTTLRALWTGSAVFAILIVTTDHIVDGVEKYSWGFYPRYAWASGAYLLFFFFGLGAALFHAFEGYKAADSEMERRRMASVAIALVIGYVALWDYLPSFGVDVLPLGFLAIAGFVLMMGYTVWRYELAEITPALVAPHVLETTRGNVVVIDAQRTICLVSEAAAALLDYQEDDLIGRPLAVLCEDLASETFKEKESEPVSFENREFVWLTRSGEHVDVSVSSGTILDRRGRLAGVVYNAEDISRRKREEALLESEVKYRTLVESMNEGVMVVNTAGLIQFVNQPMAEMLGYVSAELIGKPAGSFVDPSSRSVDASTARRVLQLRKLRRRDLWVEVSEAPLLDGKGNVTGSIRVVTDITERRAAEIALRESETAYRLLAEHATDMISRHAPDGRFLYASPASRGLLGYGPEELVGRKSSELIHPEDLARVGDVRDGVFRGAESAALMYRMRRKDGTYVRVETTWRSIWNQGAGTATEIIAVSRDISERGWPSGHETRQR